MPTSGLGVSAAESWDVVVGAMGIMGGVIGDRTPSVVDVDALAVGASRPMGLGKAWGASAASMETFAATSASIGSRVAWGDLNEFGVGKVADVT
ncbi:MAG TPA: hypothetical protein VJ001_17740 [Rhodocyclaceae bacterium]|nr:hypothetical protein [Rhodocyclaceae bacterium]